MTASAGRALVIYARAAVEGRVKTRLQPVFTPAEGLALYEAMLADLLSRTHDALSRDTTIFLAWSEPCATPDSLSELIGKVRLEHQAGDDLGERMARTFQEKLHAGFGRVCLTGADAPNIPIDYLRQSYEMLKSADIVLGPADDGGYYLIGARRLHPELFRKMPWGTDKVLSITRQRMKSAKISHSDLPAWYDVDTPTDVERLWKDLQLMSAKRLPDLPRRTHALLASLMPGRPRVR